jgi:hypothetical protein
MGGRFTALRLQLLKLLVVLVFAQTKFKSLAIAGV